MVELTTALGRSGLQDWLIQRVTAIFLAIYTVFLAGYFSIYGLHYQPWKDLFATHSMRYASLLVLFGIMAHAWVGIWTVTTDYIKPYGVRFFIQILFILALLVYLLWGIQIIWGI